MPSFSVDQVEAVLGKGLVDSATFDSHRNLRFNIEWIRLNSCPEAVDHAFINPTFANWALGKGRKGIDEIITHLSVNLDPFPFPS